MFEYFAACVSLVPTLVFVSMLIFGLQQLLPGDPAQMLAGEDQDPRWSPTCAPSCTWTSRCQCATPTGWAACCKGDLGDSMRTQLPVLDLILQKLPVTLQLAVMAMMIALLIGIPAGVVSAVGRGTAWDYAANVFALWGLSTPNFWLGILMILLFSVQLGWLPASGYDQPVRGPAGQPGKR
jgi:peptide/nickel transport system permease protein